MTTRLDPVATTPDLMKIWFDASRAIGSKLDGSLTELVKIRASQINGCANCINMHTVYARADGETEQRLYLLAAWREAPCYTERERAALAWTDALTSMADHDALASAYEAVQEHFTEEELVKLMLTIVVINGWNRIAVGFGSFVDPAAIRAAAAAA